MTSVYNAYLERLRPRIERGWVVPDGHNTVVLEVVVNADGTTSAVTIAPSQHTEEAALAARWAFAAAQPLEPLPSGSPNQAKLTITFESKAGQHESTAHLSTRLEPLPSGSASGSADGGS